LPVSDESQFRIGLRGPVGQRVEKTEQPSSRDRKGCCGLRSLPRNWKPSSPVPACYQGLSSLFQSDTGPHRRISVYPSRRTNGNETKSNHERREAQSFLKLFPGVAMFFDPGGLIKRVTSFGRKNPSTWKFTGYDFETARGVIRQVRNMMQPNTGLADIEVSREENYPEVTW